MTHYTIRILSKGESRQEARGKAISYADQLVEQGEFDYHDGEHSQTHTLASPLGKKAVEGALQANRRAFDDAIRTARMMLRDFTDEQIYYEDFPNEPRDYYASRWQFGQVDEGRCYLYGADDVWGDRIRLEKALERVMEHHEDLWVTSMDCHS